MERAQEALRFGAYTISRIVRMGSNVIKPESEEQESQLEIAFEGGAGLLDCLGGTTAEDNEVSNIFVLDNGILECGVNNGIPQPIVEGVTGFSVRYCRLVDGSSCMSIDDYVDGSELKSDWGSVGSVLIELETEAGSVNFVVTLREKVFGLANKK